jgi:magnesium transporter
VISGLSFRHGHAGGEPFDLARKHELEADAFLWLDVVDPDAADLDALRRAFGLHPVTLEDAVHRHQRTKIELFESYAFLVTRPLTFGGASPPSITEHEVHVIAGDGYVVTMRWPPVYPLDAVMTRWERRVDLHGAGFALYVILDEIVDDYLSVLEATEDEADALEDLVFERDDGGASDVQQRLFRLKRTSVALRRSAMPVRQIVDLLQEEPRFASPELSPYFRDVMDHAIRVVELTDNVRDLVTSLLEVRLAQASNQLNEAMKKMTAWAGIVLVPTLIAGIYGMNFDGMPELRWQLGYPMALGVMAAAAIGLYATFKRKGWL